MNIDHDLEKIALQESRLQFKHFDSDVAWAIGSALKSEAEKRNAPVAIDIQLHGHPLFAFGMTGTTPDNWDWIRRKRNTVLRYHRSSFAIGLKHERAPASNSSGSVLDKKEYSTHGGGFPIIVTGTGCVGSIIVSGLPQREDHEIIVKVLQQYLELTGEDLALDPAASA